MCLIDWKKLKMHPKAGKNVSVCYTIFLINFLFIFFLLLEQSDATQFTVAGRLQAKPIAQLQFIKSDIKMTPPKTVLKSLNQPQLGLAKSPSMMVPIMSSINTISSDVTQTAAAITSNANKNNKLTRSISVPGAANDDDSNYKDYQTEKVKKNGEAATKITGGSKVSVPKVDDDETFSNFFTSIQKTVIEEGVEIDDFDIIKSTEK